jgi:hypothetical protein
LARDQREQLESVRIYVLVRLEINIKVKWSLWFKLRNRTHIACVPFTQLLANHRTNRVVATGRLTKQQSQTIVLIFHG